MKLVIEKTKRAFGLTLEFVESLDEKHLMLKLPNLPSNTIGEQLWCMIGARESYLEAIKNNGWMDFTCSLTDTTSKSEVMEAVIRSADSLLSYLEEKTLSEIQIEFVFDLLEHEIQHHGQLIRYVYGNKLNFPQSWKARYTV